MTNPTADPKVEKFFSKLAEGSPVEAAQLREFLPRACALGLHMETGKNNSNLHLKNAADANFGCFLSNGRFRNYGSCYSGEKYLDDLGRLLGFPVSKEGSDHFWTVRDRSAKSIPLESFLAFAEEWLDLVAARLEEMG